MRLIDDLAAQRLYYPRPLPTLPDILLIDIPQHFAGSSLALGRYYPVIIESQGEALEFEAFLCAPRAKPVPPALLDRRPTALRARDIVFARYVPPLALWPHLLLCCWPETYTAMVPSSGDEFARGAYTLDAFSDEQDLDAAEQTLLKTLGADEARRVRSVAAKAGHA